MARTIVKPIRPQTTLPEAQVIKKIGKWTVEQYMNQNTGQLSYAICDGWSVHYPIIYDANGAVAYDNPWVIPKTVKNWFSNFAVRMWLKRTGRSKI